MKNNNERYIETIKHYNIKLYDSKNKVIFIDKHKQLKNALYNKLYELEENMGLDRCVKKWEICWNEIDIMFIEGTDDNEVKQVVDQIENIINNYLEKLEKDVDIQL